MNSFPDNYRSMKFAKSTPLQNENCLQIFKINGYS